jgi:hypothetical protein
LLAEKSEVSLFRVSGKVLLASVLVTIVIGIIFAMVSAYISVPYSSISLVGIPGGIVQEVAWIFLAIAHFRIKPPIAPTQPFQTVPICFFTGFRTSKVLPQLWNPKHDSSPILHTLRTKTAAFSIF